MKLSARNIPLAIVLVLTVLISAVLIYFVVIEHAKVSETNSKIEEYKRILEEANKKKPAPVTENFKNMTIDSENLDIKAYQIQRTFGKYYRKALITFANTIGVSGDQLKQAFRQYYLGLPDDAKADIVGSNDKSLIDNFLAGKDKAKLDAAITDYGNYINESKLLQNFMKFYNDLPDEKKGLIVGGKRDQELLKEFFAKEKVDQKRLAQAMEQFRTDIQSMTVEPVTKTNVHEFLLAAMGLPRTALVTYYKGILKNLQNLIFRQKLIPGAETMKDVEAVTYDDEFQPNQKQIPLVIRQMLMREDFFTRAKKAKITKVVSIMELTPQLVEQRVNDDYVRYTFEAVLEGPMDALRDFVNSLQSAYKDNVVYRIRDISLSRAVPEDIDDLTAVESKDQAVSLASKFQFPDFEPQNTEINLLAASYGKPMVGKSRDISMKLSFDILLYVADELKRVELIAK